MVGPVVGVVFRSVVGVVKSCDCIGVCSSVGVVGVASVVVGVASVVMGVHSVVVGVAASVC